jgi:predicted phosphodiesterase
MIYLKRNISTSLEDKMIKLYTAGYKLDDIEKITGISKSILSFYFNANESKISLDDLMSFRANGKSILVIADTHIGSEYENLKYIDLAYDMGVAKNVSSCLHLGDIIQGRFNQSDKTLEYQMEVLEKIYPEPTEFDTNLLMGNHDYAVFEYYPYYKEILENKKGLNPLGYKRVYFSWNDYLFAMDHKVKQISDTFIYDNCAVYFIGHGHELKIKAEDKLKAPTCSDDIMNKQSGSYPAFMIVNMDADYLSTDIYTFENNKAVLSKENYYEKILTKKNKVK